MAKKNNSYQKLKDKIVSLEKDKRELKSDLRKVVMDNHFETKGKWYVIFRFEDDFENMVWNGDSTFNSQNNGKERTI